MKIYTITKPLILVAAIFSCIYIVTSCGDDEVVGCTDPSAENYNELANTSGDCTYARDKFLGSYMGSITCPGQLAILSNDSLEFSLVEGLDANVTSEVILNINIDGFPLALGGSVTGNDFRIMQFLPGVIIPNIPFIGSVTADVTANGMGMMINNDTELSATLELTAVAQTAIGTLEDNCVIRGIKQ